MSQQSTIEHVAIVTGANHSIGAATAVALAARGCAVLCAYWPMPDQAKADLQNASTPARLFDAAEDQLGPVDILVNNASGWVQDTFAPATRDRHGRTLQPVSEATWSGQFRVDTLAPALLIAEFARRHSERRTTWGRIVGLTSGGSLGFPQEISYWRGQGSADELHNGCSDRVGAPGITANMVHPPVTDTGWITDSVREFVASSASHFHIADPVQVAEVIAFLTSDAAALITVIELR